MAKPDKITIEPGKYAAVVRLHHGAESDLWRKGPYKRERAFASVETATEHARRAFPGVSIGLKANRRRRSRSNHSRNREGLSFEAWSRAAGISGRSVAGAHAAWIKGKNPVSWSKSYGVTAVSNGDWMSVWGNPAGGAMKKRSSSTRQKKALLGLYIWATTGNRTGNPYAKEEVREARRALGDPSGYELPARKPRGKVAGALYDLADWSVGSDRPGNPHAKPVVRAANRALGGDGYDLPAVLAKNTRRATKKRTSRKKKRTSRGRR